MAGMIVVFKYGGTWDRAPLKALGIVDAVECHKGQERWHVKPVFWTVGSPLSKWVDPTSVFVLNADAQACTQAS